MATIRPSSCGVEFQCQPLIWCGQLLPSNREDRRAALDLSRKRMRHAKTGRIWISMPSEAATIGLDARLERGPVQMERAQPGSAGELGEGRDRGNRRMRATCGGDSSARSSASPRASPWVSNRRQTCSPRSVRVARSLARCQWSCDGAAIMVPLSKRGGALARCLRR